MATLLFEKPRLLVLLLLLVVAAGLSAFHELPRREDPELEARFGLVVTQLPGGDAARVEALVSKPIEDELRQISEIKEIRSTSRGDLSLVHFEFVDDVRDSALVMSRVRDKIHEARMHLPPEASQPELRDTDIEAFALILAVRAVEPGSGADTVAGRIADDLADRMRNLPGTREVRNYGRPDEELLVEVDPLRLAEAGLSASDVSAAVAAADSKVRAGRLRGASRRLRVEVGGDIDSIASLEDLVLRADQNGTALRLGDVARVSKGERQPQRERVLLDGARGFVVAVRLGSGQRIDRWRHRAKGLLDEFRQSMPSGIELDVIFDQCRYVTTRLSSLIQNFLLGTLAVAVVVFLMLGVRAALLVSAMLPLSSLFVLSGLSLLEIPLHQMSVTGLVIALGLLIDNGIVMVDDVRARLRDGSGKADAIRQSVSHLAMPLLGSTATTVIAFLPLALLPGAPGDFIASIGIGVILAIGGSFVLAMAVLPALTAWLSTARTGRGWLEHGVTHERLARVYRRFLETCLAKPALGIGLGLVLPIVGFLQARTLEEQFFPSADRDQFQLQVQLPDHASMDETIAAARVATDRIRSQPGVRHVTFFVGTSAPMFYYNMLCGKDDVPSFAQGIVQLESEKDCGQIVRDVQRDLDRVLPLARVLVSKFEQGPPFEAPVELYVSGPDSERLVDLGEDFREILARIAGVTHTRTSFEAARPKLRFDLDEEAARMSGFGRVALAEELEASFEGKLGGKVLESTRRLPVRVRVGTAERSDLGRLASLDLRGRRDRVPLTSLGDFSLQSELAAITRKDGQRMNAVQAFVEDGVLPDTVRRAFAEEIERVGLSVPAGYAVEFGGEHAKRDDAVANLMSSVPVLAVLLVAALVISFQSFRLAGLIALVGALSFGVALSALWMFDQVFGFMAIVGALGLIGVAINDSIVVLAAIRAHPKARCGDLHAMCHVVFAESRHVFATTLTTIAGFVPLLLAGGGFWPPLSIAIAGGVSGATLLALVFVPCVYRPFAARSGVSPAKNVS